MRTDDFADDDRRHQLEDLFRALFIKLMNRAGRSVKPEEILNAARRTAEEVAAKLGSRISWEHALRTSIRHIRRPLMAHQPVRVVGHIAVMRTPRLMTVPSFDGEPVESLVTEIELVDGAGDHIESLAILGESLVEELDETRRKGVPCEVLALVVPLARSPLDPARTFFLDIHEARRTTEALDAVGATDDERLWIESLLDELADSGQPPLDYLCEELEHGLRVVALDEFPQLRLLLRFIALQSLSIGRIDHASGRLHCIVVGPPASGKKLLGLGARVLNPTCTEAAASKISAAGLVGASYQTTDGWKSNPGLIAQADGGVVVLQDAHAISTAELRRLGPILQEVIEDGVVRDSVAGGVRRETSAALVVDLNRHAQLVQNSATAPSSEAPIILLRPLLSRIDLAVEIPADPKRAWKIGAELYKSLKQGTGTLDGQPWVRRLRLLVAALRDRHPEVDLDGVRDAMQAAHEAIAVENADTFLRLPEAGDVPVRMAISFARLVTASARAHDRSVAEPEDVDEALRFIRMKLEFLQITVPELLRSEAAPAADGYGKTYERHAGQAVRPEDFMKTYSEVTGDVISERTARRRLRRLGAVRRGRGVYLLPPSNGHNGVPS
jgi:hypothetical protein